MGGTYTRERTKARSRVGRLGSPSRRARTWNTTARSDIPRPATAKQPAGKNGSAERAHSGRSPARTSWPGSLRRRRCLGQSSSQGISARCQEFGSSGPLPLELHQRQSARGGGLGDHDEIDPFRQESRPLAKELAKESFRAVTCNGIAEFACHRNSQPCGPVIEPRRKENDRTRQGHA
jgi:hypothetical protein